MRGSVAACLAAAVMTATTGCSAFEGGAHNPATSPGAGATYAVVSTQDLVVPADQLLGITHRYGTDKVVADRSGLPRVLAHDYDRYPNWRISSVRGGGSYVGVEVTRSDTDRAAVLFMRDTDAAAFYRAKDGSTSDWMDMPISLLSDSQVVCGSEGDGATCARWTWRARYGQYVVRLDLDRTPRPVSKTEFGTLARSIAATFLGRAPTI